MLGGGGYCVVGGGALKAMGGAAAPPFSCGPLFQIASILHPNQNPAKKHDRTFIATLI